MLKITVYGQASSRLIKEFEVKSDDSRTFLKILRENGIMVASSCFGEGVCKRCIINEDTLSCKLSPSDIQDNHFEIFIGYL